MYKTSEVRNLQNIFDICINYMVGSYNAKNSEISFYVISNATGLHGQRIQRVEL